MNFKNGSGEMDIYFLREAGKQLTRIRGIREGGDRIYRLVSVLGSGFSPPLLWITFDGSMMTIHTLTMQYSIYFPCMPCTIGLLSPKNRINTAFLVVHTRLIIDIM